VIPIDVTRQYVSQRRVSLLVNISTFVNVTSAYDLHRSTNRSRSNRCVSSAMILAPSLYITSGISIVVLRFDEWQINVRKLRRFSTVVARKNFRSVVGRNLFSFSLSKLDHVGDHDSVDSSSCNSTAYTICCY